MEKTDAERKKQEEIERKREEIRARVAIARKKQDLEYAKKEALKAQAEQKKAAATQAQAAPKGGAPKPKDDGVLRIDEGYADFKVLPKDDEKGNPNFPYNLHNACELFCRTGNVESAIRVKHCVDAYRVLLAKGPDGRSKVSVGRATICWQCGHAGLPVAVKSGKHVTQGTKKKPSQADLLKASTAGLKCGHCGSGDQINFFLARVPQNGGNKGGGGSAGSPPQVLPWIEHVLS